MPWKIEQHKRGSSTMELQVSMIVKDMRDDWSYDADTFRSSFKSKLASVPKTNTYSAEFSFDTQKVAREIVEVWKMKTNGDKNFKMFTLTRE